MKNICLIVSVIFCFMPSPLFGQDIEGADSTARNEFSIVIDDIFAKYTYACYPIISSSSSLIPYYVDYSSADLNTPKIGLGYKYHFAKSAIRSKISCGLKDYTQHDKRNSSQNENSYFTLNAFLGYEFHVKRQKAQIFYGFDMLVNYNRIKSNYTYSANSQNSTSDNTFNCTGFGFSPLIGVKYSISPMISISTELKFILESYSGESVYKHSGNTEESKTEISGLSAKFGPLGQLSINIHF